MRLPIATYGRFDCVLTAGLLLAVAGVMAVVPVALHAPQLAFAALLPVALAAFAVSFYRDFERTIPADAGLVVSPADGTVTDVVEVDEKEWIGGRALRVGIFLSPLNVHVNRSPVAGTVEKVVHREGKMLKAYDPRAIDENESTLLALRAEDGLKVSVRQVTGALARRIVCAAQVGQRLARGERYGMIKLGSRTELLLPKDAGFVCRVKPGDKVRGGITILGELPARATGGSTAVPAMEAKS